MKSLLARIPLARLIKNQISLMAKRILFTIHFARYKNELTDGRFACTWKDRLPCLHDATKSTAFDPHYFYHPAWAARIIAKTPPPQHVDIGSSLSFCSIISAFIPTKFYDYRPIKCNLPGLETDFADLTSLPFEDKSIISLSCMHTIEHIGLGRYGDTVDPKGDVKALNELWRVLAIGGTLLLVVPIGRPIIQFNAHRIYSYQFIASFFDESTILNFSLVTDEGLFIQSASPELADKQKYGCGCFLFAKIG